MNEFRDISGPYSRTGNYQIRCGAMDPVLRFARSFSGVTRHSVAGGRRAGQYKRVLTIHHTNHLKQYSEKQTTEPLRLVWFVVCI